MSRLTAKLYLGFGLIFSVLCALTIICFYEEFSVIAPLAFLICVSLPLTFAGYCGIKRNRDNSEEEEFTKERDAAMILSFIPGLGHSYLGEARKGIPHLLLLIVVIILMLLFVLIACKIIVEAPETAAAYLLYGIILLVFVWLWSAIDVHELCNKQDLPYENGFFEMRLKNSDHGRLLVFIIFYAIGLLASGFMLSEEWISSQVFWIVSLVSALAPLYALYAASKARLKTHS
ncbi:hypothetical protein [Candidatus Methanomassiliicoccus intestinalis]|uniref:hypothetical protein n=1 Tax=Candidatus Methanomassiliicoccus intestinalis TaxID=1406512 RepID=UPI0037DCE3B9